MVNSIQQLYSQADVTGVSFGKFNEKTNELQYSVEYADRTVKNFTATMDGVNGAVVTQVKSVGKSASAWQTLGTMVGTTAKQMLRATVGYNMAFAAIRELRKGYNYVKEIDLALTELKKVTDEAEAAYSNFLNTASKTAGNIGTTVSDFTEATANFARLGYSMSESASMAESAVIYKNVADGIDSVDAATDSIISTMKAFGIESNNTMSIIDKFNEVGNKFAITSSGIGEAMQRSASALYAAGNTLDESISLITAGNSVIQNPEQVGETIADYKVA